MINLDVVGGCLVQRGDTTVALDQEGLGTKSSSDIYWKRNESESEHRGNRTLKAATVKLALVTRMEVKKVDRVKLISVSLVRIILATVILVRMILVRVNLFW